MSDYESSRHVAVYAVGWLAALQRAWRAVVLLHSPSKAWSMLRQEWSMCVYWARRRNWRAVKNTFNGYLAEHEFAGSRAGHGWTKRRALRDLERHLAGRDA